MSEPSQPTAAQEPKGDSSGIIAKLNEIGSEFMIAQEWGIFKPSAPNTVAPLESEIIDALELVRKEAEAGKIAEAQTAFLHAKSALTRAQRQSWWHRANNQIGLLPIIATFFAVMLAFNLVCWGMKRFPNHQDQAHAAIFGLAGATLRSLFWLQFQIGKGLLRPRWMATFLVAPFIGLLLGAISFLMVVVDSKLVDATAQANSDPLTVGLFAAFAGYNWEWALEKFLILANTLASKVGIGSNSPANPTKRSP